LKTENKLFLILLVLISCTNHNNFDIQGHRGARGILPENSILGFIKSVDIGVKTIELDVVITKDLKVLVSHEPWISNVICLDSLGLKLSDEINKYNIYNLNYDVIKKFDCGSLGNPNFLFQIKTSVSKPLLKEAIIEVENYVRKNNLDYPNYNIEIKSSISGDNLFHPSYQIFSDLVFAELIKLISTKRFIIQSFDFRVLKYFNAKYPNVKLSVLVDNDYGSEKNLNDLGFSPNIYSPNFKKLSKSDINFLKKKNIEIIPWTVNSYDDITKVLKLNVDGIISDYPNRVIDILR